MTLSQAVTHRRCSAAAGCYSRLPLRLHKVDCPQDQAWHQRVKVMLISAQCTGTKLVFCAAVQEISMLKGLNYDCNITQFYGACIQPGGHPMLISEFMDGVSCAPGC